MSKSGLLIAFEGIDGCGKSTQAQRFVERHQERVAPRAIGLVREPGGTPFGERVRELLLHGDGMSPLPEMLLYMASRAELYTTCVGPALDRDEVVVLDRSHYSTAAYQGSGLDVDEELIFELARRATGGREPDRVVLLDTPVVEAARRRQGVVPVGADAGSEGPVEDRIESRGDAYFETVRAAYLRYAAAAPDRFRVVDGTGDAQAVVARVDAALEDLLS